MRTLVADDDRTTRLILERLLPQWGYEPVPAADGIQAWEALTDDEAPRLAILDWDMPGLTGVEICRRLREAQRDRSTYAIILTSHDRRDDIVQGLRAGADDYLTKPFDKEELQARLNVGARLLRLQSALADRLQEIEDTLRAIQRSFLLGRCPTGLRGVSIAAKTIASQQVAGDFFDFHSHGSTCLDLAIGDVMGKGLKAALLGAATVTELLRSLRDLSAQNGTDGRPPAPACIIDSLRQDMSRHLSEQGSFVTLSYARLDLERSLLTFVDCGHQRPIHFCRREQQCRLLKGENMPLGFADDDTCVEVRSAFEPGDVLVFYSDGITETRGDDGMFGEERLVDLVTRNAGRKPEELLSTILDGAKSFALEHEFSDDATCIVVEIEEPPGANGGGGNCE